LPAATANFHAGEKAGKKVPPVSTRAWMMAEEGRTIFPSDLKNLDFSLEVLCHGRLPVHF
jgi:hypothetical protein